MNHYKEGDTVRVVFEKVRITDVSDFESAELTGRYEDDCGVYPVPLPLGRPGVAIARVAPAEWPPQAKEIWDDRDGDPWVARLIVIPGEDSFIELVPSDPDKLRRDYWDDLELINNRFGPFTLVRHNRPQADGSENGGQA